MKATFGGGCFWCTEVIFQHIDGVNTVLPGYMGGKTENPTYEEICKGDTDHVEVIEIDYDEGKVSFNDLLKVFFRTHNPTTLNRQGNDVGTQYRSVVFYHSDEQRLKAEEIIKKLEDAGVYADPIVTSVESAQKFWPAEDYHKNYFNLNPQNPYCAAVIAPKLQKFLQEFK
ncbi:peptide-methionine (S)-S-oxide reductase MsrA [Sphingobacterium sp. UT-1RO-CII-1]|uniref:peptide-methionine (S)-S-oxide reductase MsrA n=1 Tax=Sphingobacterium sp. UT-1RO-CII-1 TaxID=2995225 RepID=UPI00227A8D12|nr:peptide-methionine (S)-S-oxide reductase MsrA [Sphingobacterium sp. UT-1RO-CII-1]MCY4781305.1 peptide-methionine (S)-S-oxide reductase MsrA [Sphingobacterium sp. UT-1RO-CII-1]